MQQEFKIMFIIDSNLSGGAERVISILCNFFAEKKYSVILLNFDKDSAFYKIDESVKVIKLGKIHPEIYDTKNKYIKKLRLGIQVYNIISQVKPDIVIPFLFDAEFLSIPVCLVKKVACITSVRNAANRYPLPRRIFRKITYPFISQVVFQSEEVRKHKDFCKLKNTCVIPNPLAINIIKERYLNVDNNKIIAVGRLEEQKNHEIAINAIASLVTDFPEIKLHIFGDGSLKEVLNKQINDLHLKEHVFLEGVVDNAQYNNRDAKLFIMTSRYEGFPNALIEAMACKIPVICTDFNSGTSRELLDNGQNGILIPVDDLDGLINAIRFSLKNNNEAEQLNRASEKCKEYRIENIGKKWELIIIKAIAESKAIREKNA